MCRIELSKVFHSFGDRLVLRGVNLDLNSGECGVLLGKNGAGKSTVLRLLAGVLSPERGTVLIEGMTPRQIRRGRQTLMGIALQQSFLYSDLTIEENLQLSLLGRPSKADTRFADIVARFELGPYLSLLTKNASQGIAQKASLARCFLRKCHLLLLDEPFAHLDTESRLALCDQLREEQGRGATILCVVHDLDLLKSLSYRCFELRHGEILTQ